VVVLDNAGFNTSKVIRKIPVTLNGDMTINADPSHVGFTSSARNIANDLSKAVMTPNTSNFQALGNDFSKMSIRFVVRGGI
jgi:hypothetical protein